MNDRPDRALGPGDRADDAPVHEHDRDSGGTTLVVRHPAMSKRAAASVAAEGRRLLRLMAAGARQADVRLEAAP